jgi:glycosyltransferase involved in cell wall biosynthesis
LASSTLNVAPAHLHTPAEGLPSLRRPRVLTFADYFLPGYRAGGTLRTLANMVEQLGDELHFHIVTRDRDEGDTAAYSGIRPDTWQRMSKAEVFYGSPALLSGLSMDRIIARSAPDLLYLNSFFSPGFTLQPLLLRQARWRHLPVVLAPRGEFAPGALRLKRYKKLPYLRLARTLGVYRDVVWQVSSRDEEADLRAWFGPRARVFLAPDLFSGGEREPPPMPEKVRGAIRIAFVGRITRMKNLEAAIEALQHVSGDVVFTIYGPVADGAYWEHCRQRMRTLPPGVRVEYAGPLPHAEIAVALRRHHLFLMPSLGENFGHAIAEALVNGCPVIISDRTWWNGVREAGVGWSVPLGDREALRAAVQACVDMDGPRYAELSRAARRYGLERSRDPGLLRSNRELFRYALAGTRVPEAEPHATPMGVYPELRSSTSQLS